MSKQGEADQTVRVESPLALWRTLARAGPKATAENLDAQELARMHVATSLDRFVADQVTRGVSVVLTGNAGDGKTHMLRQAKQQLIDAGADVLEDATAAMRGGDPKPVLDRWAQAAEKGQPFCVAINEYPLYQLRNTAPQFAPLAEVWRQCRHRLAYGAPDGSEDAQGKVLVIDLSLRNPLAPSFFDAVLAGLLGDPALRHAITAEPETIVARNALKLSDERTRQRLRSLLQRLIALGGRATVREVWILVARMLLSLEDGYDYRRTSWYSEALFNDDPRFPLSALMRSIDPAQCSHPRWDVALETRAPSLREGWRFPEPSIPPHPHLAAADFAALKRAFYFEHADGEQALNLIDPEAEQFRALLNEPRESTEVVARLVDAINAAYCPASFTGREHHLYLWAGHRFHEQPTRSFVAVDRVGVEELVLERPRLPRRLEGAFDYHGDHLMLIAPEHGGARLRIDYPLFRTLRRLGRGLPRKLVPEREIHRLDAFLELLGATRRGDRATVWSVHLENLQVIKVGLSADGRRYESVRLNA